MDPILSSMEQELNPFEQSSHQSNDPPKSVLPPLTATSIPLLSDFTGQNLMMMPIPSTCSIVFQNSVDIPNNCSSMITPDTLMRHTLSRNPSPQHQHQPILTKKRRTQKKQNLDDDEKRRNFLERNRQAALKCRQRKKRWLSDLQTKVEYLTNDNEQLQVQCEIMRDELIRLRRMLWDQKVMTSVSKGLQAPLLSLVHRGSDSLLQPMIASESSITSPTFSATSSFYSSPSSPTHSLEQALSAPSNLASLDYTT